MTSEFVTAISDGVTSISSDLQNLISGNVTTLMTLFVVVIALPFILRLIKRISGR